MNRVFREGDRVLIATDQSNVRKGPARFPGVQATIIRRNQVEDRHGGLWLVELIDPACNTTRVVPIHGIHLTPVGDRPNGPSSHTTDTP
ncbi:MAG: hypothetical protein O9327_02540 [Polaromonas sp.]|nr:hypothetical protein [Polaromonas sp.]